MGKSLRGLGVELLIHAEVDEKKIFWKGRRFVSVVRGADCKDDTWSYINQYFR